MTDDTGPNHMVDVDSDVHSTNPQREEEMTEAERMVREDPYGSAGDVEGKINMAKMQDRAAERERGTVTYSLRRGSAFRQRKISRGRLKIPDNEFERLVQEHKDEIDQEIANSKRYQWIKLKRKIRKLRRDPIGVVKEAVQGVV